MPDTRAHRGPHPEDAQLFAEEHWPTLRRAMGDLSRLLSQGYAEKSALKLVGDRYSLRARQRTAVQRCACADGALAVRRARCLPPAACRGAHLAVDGYNLLITLESALAGACILEGRDGCYRDLASLHGTYRTVEETRPAIELAGRALQRLGAAGVTWYLDAPVSNSGRLKAAMGTLARANGWPWEVRLVPSPDPVLAAAEAVVVTSDSWILDRAGAWSNLARVLIGREVAGAAVLPLGG